MLTQPAWALGQFCFLAMVAGLFTGGLSSYQGGGLEQSVKSGSKSAVISTIVASACFALMLRTLPGEFAALRGLLIPLVVALPAILAGSMGAVLGALFFRRNETTSESSPNESSVALRWPEWCIIVAAVLTLLICPLFPTPFPPELRPRVATVENRIPFHYTTPEALATAPASAWALQTQRLIGNIDSGRAFALSRDERFIAGGNGDTISVYDLESEGVITFPPVSFPLAALAFSPSGERLFFVCDGDPRRLGVAEIKSRKVILLPQPKRHLVPEGRVFWRSEKEVVFAPKISDMKMLNLDSLELDPVQFSLDESNRIWQAITYPLTSNDRWAMGRELMWTSAELPETEGVQTWPIQGQIKLIWRDSKHAAIRFFPEINLSHDDRIIGLKDGSKVLRFHNNVATAFYFTTRPIPPLRWRIPMPHGPEKLRESEAATKALAMGQLSLVLYSPMINPLTQKTIGPDREHPKALLRVESWSGNEAEVWVYKDYFPFASGDVLADVHMAMSGPDIFNFDQPHRWFVVAPDPVSDATDPKLLPSIAQMEKRRTEVMAKLAEETAAARLAAQAKQEETTPAPILITPKSPQSEPVHPTKGAQTLSPLEKEITAFVVEHHAKATRGEITEMVEDYAQQVDHFNNGIVDRLFIYNDEFQYHQKMEKLIEEVDGSVNFREIRNGVFEARYVMSNFWRRHDGKSGRSRNEITLEIVKQSGVWQIIKHRSVSIK